MDRESMSAVMTGLAWPRRFAVLPALRVFARDVGPLGIGGIVLLATAALAWPLLVTAPQRSAQELRRDSARLRVRQAAPSAPPAVLLPALQIERFGAHFPPAVRLPASLSAISRAAGASNVVLSRGEYKLADEAGLGVLRYEVNYPLRAKWRDLFAFVAAVLNENPHAALDEIVFRRESRAAGEVEAQIRLSIYFSAAPTGAGATKPGGRADRPQPVPGARLENANG